MAVGAVNLCCIAQRCMCLGVDVSLQLMTLSVTEFAEALCLLTVAGLDAVVRCLQYLAIRSSAGCLSVFSYNPGVLYKAHHGVLTMSQLPAI